MPKGIKKKKKNGKKGIDRRYRLNLDTISLNMEKYCAQDPLFPFNSTDDLLANKRVRSRRR